MLPKSSTDVTSVERTFTKPPAVGGARVRRARPCGCVHLGPYSQIAASGSQANRGCGENFRQA
jgi:hypothetical protein